MDPIMDEQLVYVSSDIHNMRHKISQEFFFKWQLFSSADVINMVRKYSKISKEMPQFMDLFNVSGYIPYYLYISTSLTKFVNIFLINIHCGNSSVCKLFTHQRVFKTFL